MGSSTLRILCQQIQSKGAENIILLLKVTTEADTAINSLELGEVVNGQELGVVLNGKTSTNGLEDGEGDVGELVHVDKRDGLGDLGEVGEGQGLQLRVASELKTLGNALKGGNLEVLGVGDLDLGSELELVHGDVHVVTVVEDKELLGDIDKIRVESGDLPVVVNLEAIDGGDTKTAQIAEVGVANSDGADLSNALGTENQRAETGESDEAELANVGQSIHLKGLESFESLEGKLATDGGNGAAGQGDDLGSIVGNEIASNLLGTGNNDLAGNGLVDDKVGINDLAVDGGCRRGDLDILGASGGACCWTLLVHAPTMNSKTAYQRRR